MLCRGASPRPRLLGGGGLWGAAWGLQEKGCEDRASSSLRGDDGRNDRVRTWAPKEEKPKAWAATVVKVPGCVATGKEGP